MFIRLRRELKVGSWEPDGYLLRSVEVIEKT